jgi:predicted amidohydrolase YtcJ
MTRRCLAFVFLLAIASCAPDAPDADLVLQGGRIYTVDPANPWVEAVAVREGEFQAVGSDADMDPLIGPETVLVDLGGRFALPGLIDTHLHLLSGSLLLQRVRLDEAQSLEEMKEIVRVYARAHPQQEWIVGHGWYYGRIDGGRLPTRQDLDEVVPNRPVFLTSYDDHTAWVNSRALEIAGVNRDSAPEGPGEIIHERGSREPSGALREEGAMRLVRSAIPRPSRAELLNALRAGMAYAHRFGITSVHTATGVPDEDATSGYPDDDIFDLFEELERRGELALRIYAAMSVDETTTDDMLDTFAQLKARYRGPRLKAGAVKIFVDGVIESHTAAMLEPYADDPQNRGKANYTPEELSALVSHLDGRGFQIFAHAIGDRGVRMALDAYEAVARPGRDSRHRIEHIEIVDESDIPRFAEIGVIASMQPLHGSPDFGGVWSKAVGPGRLPRAFAWGSFRRAGARLIHGSDWPVVTLDPLLGIYTAVTREDLEGKPEGGWFPSERVSLEDAISGYTLDAAYASFDDGIKGSIRAGKLADLVVLSHNLFDVPPREIAETEALMTMIGGDVVYASPRFLTEETRSKLLSRRTIGGRP